MIGDGEEAGPDDLNREPGSAIPMIVTGEILVITSSIDPLLEGLASSAVGGVAIESNVKLKLNDRLLSAPSKAIKRKRAVPETRFHRELIENRFAQRELAVAELADQVEVLELRQVIETDQQADDAGVVAGQDIEANVAGDAVGVRSTGAGSVVDKRGGKGWGVRRLRARGGQRR